MTDSPPSSPSLHPEMSGLSTSQTCFQLFTTWSDDRQKRNNDRGHTIYGSIADEYLVSKPN